MEWYYALGDERIGPLEQGAFEALIEGGEVTDDTLVWHQDLGDWQPLGQLAPQALGGELAEPGEGHGSVFEAHDCAECGRSFPADEMIRYGDLWVCGECKPIFYQRVEEGAVLPGALQFAGFWHRFLAKFVDYLITGAVALVVGVAIAPIMVLGGESASGTLAIIGVIFYYILSNAIPVAYNTWFVGRFGATPGKMACGLKIVRAGGERVTYWRAFGRYFAEMLSSIILFIGYIMAAFDEEKRALHDHICDTRVIVARRSS